MNIEKSFFVEGKIVDLHERTIHAAEVKVNGGIIEGIRKIKQAPEQYILPGFIDAHVHVESSMLTPGYFAGMAVRCGTVGAVCDPHEIANVLGEKGIQFMIRDGEKTPFKFFFGVPSCVPATAFENSGSVIDAHTVGKLLERKDIHFLAEMMNFPSVIRRERETMEKIDQAVRRNKRIDGHAPGLTGKALANYANAGITTDHESVNLYEAEEKIGYGIKILIRQGSAAKNLIHLLPLVERYPDHVMLCTDDIHPDDLSRGYIDNLVKTGVSNGIDLFHMLRAATVNPVEHYGLDVGLLRQGDPADFIVVNNLVSFGVLKTYINGAEVYNGKRVLYRYLPGKSPNKFIANPVNADLLRIKASAGKVNVITARDGELVTGWETLHPKISCEEVVADTGRDLLKICVVNRYKKAKPTMGLIKGFGLKRGAMAGSIAHDSHNVIGVGTNDTDLAHAVNNVISYKGGIVIAEGHRIRVLELPVAGLMSDKDGFTVARKYEELNRMVNELGSNLTAPFMTLSFMALLVIPELKIGDKGLFDVRSFHPVSLFEQGEYPGYRTDTHPQATEI